MADPAADLLLERAVLFLFTTGYYDTEFPGGFATVARCSKPTDTAQIMQAIGRIAVN